MTDTLEPSERAIRVVRDVIWPHVSEFYAGDSRAAATFAKKLLTSAYAIDARPVVKALEWEDFGLDTQRAETPFGDYVIRLRETGCQWWPAWGDGFEPQEETSIKTAKQACQDHFASLITQCLEPAAPVVSEWQPIETAPKDGTPVLVVYADMVVASEFQKGYWRELYDWRLLEGDHVTHWMPLPWPPADLTPTEGEG